MWARMLCPALQKGDIVVMDNLGAHKSAATLALIAAVGAEVLFLPAYSPEFNPIEKMWSKGRVTSFCALGSPDARRT